MSSISLNLNERAASLWRQLSQQAAGLRIKIHDDGDGGIVADFGVDVEGGLTAGLALARICLANLANVTLQTGNPSLAFDGQTGLGQAITVYTDHPCEACLASQYAGWQISHETTEESTAESTGGANASSSGDCGRFFAMGSGPMRGLTGKEDLFKDLGYPAEFEYRHSEDIAVGVLETATIPSDEVAEKIARDCDVDVRSLLLCVAPTASIAGHIQVVARSVETALHKLHELQFDLSRVVSGFGSAPLPPIAKGDLEGIGRTNDAILYGGKVTLWVRGDDESLEEIVGRVPSSASKDYGRPFGELFASYNNDFYRIDPHLFSPAVIEFINLDTGHRFSAGELRADILEASFA